MRKTLLYLSFLCTGLVNAQLATRIDQYYQDWSLINPAAINSMRNASFSTFYNRLYTGVTGSPENLFASLVIPNSEKRLGFAANFGQEKIGFSATYNGSMSYAYSLPFRKNGRSILHTAVTVGLLSQRFNPNAIDVVSPDDPQYLSLQQGRTVSRFDLKASMAYQNGGLLMGLSIGRLTRPSFAFDYYTYQYDYAMRSITAGFISMRMKVNKDIMLQPVAVTHLYDFSRAMLQWGMNMELKNRIWCGLHSTGFKNVSLQVGARFQQAIRVGYSYSMPFSANSRLLGSGHEVYLSVAFSSPKGNRPADFDMFVLRKVQSDSTELPDNTDIVKDEPNKPETVESNSPVVKVESIKIKNDTIVINSFDEMKFLKTGYDTAKIVFKPVSREFPANGYYVTVGVFKSEANANRWIKTMYKRGITAYKFFLPDNNSFYVYIFRGDRPEEADEVKWQEQLEIPDIWTKWIVRKSAK